MVAIAAIFSGLLSSIVNIDFAAATTEETLTEVRRTQEVEMNQILNPRQNRNPRQNLILIQD